MFLKLFFFLLIDHCWTEVQVLVLQRIVTLWRSRERDTLVNHMCWRVWVSTAQQSRTDPVDLFIYFSFFCGTLLSMCDDRSKYRKLQTSVTTAGRSSAFFFFFFLNDNRSAFLSLIRHSPRFIKSHIRYWKSLFKGSDIIPSVWPGSKDFLLLGLPAQVHPCGIRSKKSSSASLRPDDDLL